MTKLPQIKGDRLVAALKKQGWYVDRTHGSHVIMRNGLISGVIIVVPIHKKAIKLGTLGNILKKANISVEQIKESL